ncbi:hypothetical protein KKF91_14175 [Myxococcota bacterium]|nr:hypothetical protein [Myxococcota bacterium]
MSATNRGAAREGFDFYATPPWAAEALLPYLQRELASGLVLEPSAGDGALLRVLMSAGVACERLRGVELRADGVARVKALGVACERADFLKWQPEPRETPRLIITNPPFNLAFEFAQRAVQLIDGRGAVALLVRLGWLASVRRAAWHREHPADVYVLPRRPSFTSDGKSDASDYCWWVYRARRAHRFGSWRVL